MDFLFLLEELSIGFHWQWLTFHLWIYSSNIGLDSSLSYLKINPHRNLFFPTKNDFYCQLTLDVPVPIC